MPHQSTESLQAEIAELRGREAEYRQRLTRVAELAKHADALQRRLRSRPPSRADLSRTMLEVAEVSSQALDVDRTSIWFIDAQRRTLTKKVLLIRGERSVADPLSLPLTDCKRYIDVLAEGAPLAVVEVASDARVVELRDYCSGFGIGALLDVPLVIAGDLVGVVCHEQVGGPREWTAPEIEFVSTVGNLVTLALETERRALAEYAARDTEAKYRHLVESLPVTVYSFDFASGKLEYVSPRVYELGGWTAEQWLAQGAQSWLDQIHPDDRAAVLARFDPDALQGFPEELTYRVRLPDGEQRWVRDSCGLVRDHRGQPIAVQGVLADVTAWVAAERERVELERRNKEMLENMELVAFMLDASAKVTYVNAAFLRVTGFERERIIGSDWFDLVVPQREREQIRAWYERNLRRGHVVPRFEWSIPTANGEQRRLLWTNNVLRDAEGTAVGTSSLGLDLTDYLRLEAELLQQAKVESLGRLAAGVAHDFSNLLTVMIAQTSVLGSEAGDLDKREAVRGLDTALDQAVQLVRSLLVYGRGDDVAGTDEPVDELLVEAEGLLKTIAGPELRVEVRPNAPAVSVGVRRSHLRQMLLNLVGNAADATRGHGSRICVSTHVQWLEERAARRRGAREGGEFLVLTIADDGRGMERQTLSRIFDPFYTTKDDNGTGLGLAICQAIVRRGSGFIEVTSAVNEGTSFAVFLPRRGGQAQVPRVRQAPPASQARRVMVVDGDAGARQRIARTLAAARHRVLFVDDLQAAAQSLNAEAFDVLLVDTSLPDGEAFARSARSVHPDLRVVGLADRAAAASDLDAVLTKPIDEASLLRAIGGRE